MEKNEKKKNSKKTVLKLSLVITGVIVLGKIVYVCVKNRYNSLEEEKNVGNLLKFNEPIELENGSKEFVTTIDGVGFLNRGDTDGVWVSADALKDKINPETLESITGNPNFRIRPGQEMNYSVKVKLGILKALAYGAKNLIGFIALRGKEI